MWSHVCVCDQLKKGLHARTSHKVFRGHFARTRATTHRTCVRARTFTTHTLPFQKWHFVKEIGPRIKLHSAAHVYTAINLGHKPG